MMATENVTDTAAKSAKGGTKVSAFSPADAEFVRRNAEDARSICRVVALANDAVMDGSVQLDNRQTSRWEPSIDVACAKIRAIGAVMTGTSGSPVDIDWWTSLNLLEALGAGLWHCNGLHQNELEHVEFEAFIGVAIESLDAMLQECEAMGPVVNSRLN